MSYRNNNEKMRLMRKKIIDQGGYQKSFSSRPSKSVVILSAILLIFFGLGLYILESDLLSKIQLGFVTPSLATDGESTQKNPSNNEQSESIKRNHNELTDESSLAVLVEKEKKLKAKEEELKKFEEELLAQQKELSAKFEELRKMREDITKLLSEQISQDEKRVDQLVEVYSSMKPAQAAKVFEEMNEELAIKIFERMKKKNAADILNFMKTEKAKSLTERISGFRLGVINAR
ncbi:MAG: hypothetical protein NZ480_04200 [Bdellovibrionaceae bacterium]|nr:hypothetical protein [Pseudobdellovibrionaceae bacterium]MDW8189961.1 hypothetical protein [Pseudobdellovibrionaceae bacterium]